MYLVIFMLESKFDLSSNKHVKHTDHQVQRQIGTDVYNQSPTDAPALDNQSVEDKPSSHKAHRTKKEYPWRKGMDQNGYVIKRKEHSGIYMGIALHIHPVKRHKYKASEEKLL